MKNPFKKIQLSLKIDLNSIGKLFKKKKTPGTTRNQGFFLRLMKEPLMALNGLFSILIRIQSGKVSLFVLFLFFTPIKKKNLFKKQKPLCPSSQKK